MSVARLTNLLHAANYFVMQSIQSTRPAAFAHLACMSAFVLFLVNWWHPAMRLNWAEGNAIVAFVAWTLPLAGTLKVAPRLHGLRRALFVTIMLPVMAFSAAPELFELFNVVDIAVDTTHRSVDPLLKPLQTIAIPDGSGVVMYRTTCALLCSNGIEIRHEAMIDGPLEIVRVLYANYPTDSANVQLIDSHTVTVNGVNVRLRPHVVF
jgi:hypothetical protein